MVPEREKEAQILHESTQQRLIQLEPLSFSLRRGSAMKSSYFLSPFLYTQNSTNLTLTFWKHPVWKTTPGKTATSFFKPLAVRGTHA